MTPMTLIQVSPEQLEEIVNRAVERALAGAGQGGPAEKDILTVAEAGEIANRSPETIRDWIASGRLRALPRSGRQQYRIRREDLEAALVSPTPNLDAEAWADGVIALDQRRAKGG